MIKSIEELEGIYAQPKNIARWKELDYINNHYQQFIEKSPFLILSTYGENGIDCSPRGDSPGFVRVINKHCIQLPDRKGNNRLDSLKNIINNPDIGVLFIIPNVGETIRLRGKAKILSDKKLCDSYAVNGKPAITVLSIDVKKVYYQCQKAIYRAKLWDSSSYINRSELPTAGQMNKVFSEYRNEEFNAQAYDKNYPQYMKDNAY